MNSEERPDPQSLLAEEDGWTELSFYLRKMLGVYAQLPPEDLDDAASHILLQYWELSRSKDGKRRELAVRLAQDPKLKHIWVRSRINDYLRRRWRLVKRTQDLRGAEELMAAPTLDSSDDVPSQPAGDFISSLRGTVIQRLGRQYEDVLTILLDSARSGVPQSVLAEERGMDRSTFHHRKKRVIAALREAYRDMERP